MTLYKAACYLTHLLPPESHQVGPFCTLMHKGYAYMQTSLVLKWSPTQLLANAHSIFSQVLLHREVTPFHVLMLKIFNFSSFRPKSALSKVSIQGSHIDVCEDT